MMLTPGGIVPAADALTGLLEDVDGLCVSGCTQTSQKAIALIRRLRPDVMLLDFHGLDRRLISVARSLASFPRPPHVIALTDPDGDFGRSALMSAGAEHVLPRTDGEQLLEVIGDIRNRWVPGGGGSQ